MQEVSHLHAELPKLPHLVNLVNLGKLFSSNSYVFMKYNLLRAK